jgi:hypothetical protein
MVAGGRPFFFVHIQNQGQDNMYFTGFLEHFKLLTSLCSVVDEVDGLMG